MRAAWVSVLVYYFSLLGVSAHTWIEQLQVIGANGSYAGDYGYARGFVDRTDPLFGGYSNKWQIPDPAAGERRISTGMHLCHPSQRTANHSSRYPQLHATPGQYVAMKYLENGHVTRPWDPEGKPKRGGTVWVYGIYDPKPTESLYEVLRWSMDEMAGDGRGWLLAAQDFDDGRCHQLSDAEESKRRQYRFPNHIIGQPDVQAEQWCETDVEIPVDAQMKSTLTIYWVWGLETAPGSSNGLCGKDEYYVSCLDIELGGKDGFQRNAEHELDQQDPQTSAVQGYKHRSALRVELAVITAGDCDLRVTSAYTSSSLHTEATTGSEGKSRPHLSQTRLYTTAGNSTRSGHHATSTSCSDPASYTGTTRSTVTTTSPLTLD